MTQIEAFDEQGRLVQTLPATGLKATLDVSSWPRGTYLLRILTPAGPTTKKLLVQ
ncbi:MAG: T9SS type A sorting domain-containing protein [Bacteroidales bacterium]|nr:T9SS type A sorting domain-containing protein [Bacteroidales bacterium]